MTELPTGTVTFLFTDIEASTKQVSKLGDDRWAKLLDIHRRLLHNAFAAHSGVEVNTEGDAVFVAFERATDAIHAAVDGQLGLMDHDWQGDRPIRVRMGLHTGEAAVRGGDYIGLEVHRAARICNAGHGGQILLSQTTVDLVGSLPEQTALEDLGAHRLKDLSDPQRLFQLTHTRLESSFPALRALDAHRHNLPSYRSPLIGRTSEIRAVRDLMARHRLVTLTGVGGSGKTRLAVHAGAEELDERPKGVFFVDLAVVAEPGAVPRAFASALGLSDDPTGPRRERLVLDYLARRSCLLVVDNCEHLLDASAALIDRILAECPDASILATSREALNVEGEQAWRIPSLAVPDDDADAVATESVQLFESRARAADPEFRLSEDTVSHVARICRRLDGIPLAIELAAARVTHLAPHRIAERLDDMFRLLTGGGRRVQRQQTLGAAIDWSYELLEPDESRLFRRLAVFHGDFSLDAAEGICSDVRSPRDVVDVLGSLVSKSLVFAKTVAGDTRYDLLQTLRHYAAEKLRDAGESEDVRRRHWEWYCAWLEAFSLEDCMFNSDVGEQIAREADQLRAAVDWAIREVGAAVLPRIGRRLTSAAEWFFEDLDGWTAWVRAAGGHESQDDTDASGLVVVDGYGALARGDVSGMARTVAAVRDWIERGDPSPDLAVVLRLAAYITSTVGLVAGDPATLDEARQLSEQGCRVGAALGEPWEANCLAEHAAVLLNLSDIVGSAEASRRGLAALGEPERFDQIKEQLLAARTVACLLLGDHDAALEAANQLQPIGVGIDEARTRLGFAAPLAFAAGGEVSRAVAAVVRALELDSESVLPLVANGDLITAAVVEFLRGDPRRASRLLGAGTHAGITDSGPTMRFRSPHVYAVYRHYAPLVRDALDPEDARRLRDEGRAMSLDEAVAYAIEGLRS